MKYKAVIFDLFGTLVNNFTLSEYNSMLAKMSAALSLPIDNFKKLWSESFKDRITGIHRDQRDSFKSICRKLGVKASEEQIEKAFQIRLDFSRRTTIPRPGAVHIINKLRQEGYKAGLISDCTAEIPLLWNDTPFANIFDATIFSCSVGMKKPDPRVYRIAVEQLGVKPEECLYIGDGSSNELTGALKAGMHPVLIRDRDDSADADLLQREDDWKGSKITSLKEVLDILVD